MTCRFAVVLLSIGVVVLAAPRASRAEGEATFVVGGLIGGDIGSLERESILSSFQDAPGYGFRLGAVGFPWAFELGYFDSSSGLDAVLEQDLVAIDGGVSYLEGNLTLIILPTPIAPFVTGGGGLHRFTFDVDVDIVGFPIEFPTINKFGFNYGGGVKANISVVTLRFDIRDHVTNFDESDFGIGPELARLLGVEFSERVHNVEASFGIGVRF